MSCAETMKMSGMLRDKEDKCHAQGQYERVPCSGTMKTSVLLGYKEDTWLAQRQ